MALYADENFMGSCRLYGVGDYANLDDLGNNEVESIQVGGNVKATLYSRTDLRGRGETFAADDINLSNNILNSNTASSMKVMADTAAPAIPALVWPAAEEPDQIAYGTEGMIGIKGGKVVIRTPSEPEERTVEPDPLQPGYRSGPENLLHCLESGEAIMGTCNAVVSRNAHEILEAGLVSADTGREVRLPIEG